MEIYSINNSDNQTINQNESVGQQVQDIINKYNNALYQWMQTWMQNNPQKSNEQPWEYSGRMQSAFNEEQSLLSTELGNDLSALGAKDWHNWDEIDSLNPWAAYSNYASKLGSYIYGDPTQPLPAPSGGSGPQQQIEQDTDAASKIVTDLTAKRDADQKALDALNAQIQKIKDLDAEVNALPAGSEKDKALQDLQAALHLLAALTNDAQTMQSALDSLNAQLETASAKLTELTQLEQLPNPSSDDAKQADSDLSAITAASVASVSLQAAFDAANQQSAIDGSKINTILAQVNRDLQPSPSGGGKVENGVWYLDYTSWNPTTVPEGVNTVNIFVSGLEKDASGHYTIGGLQGFATPQDLQNFIDACHAKGVAVKISIGGNGGSYDDVWDLLDGTNPSAVAQGMIDFCRTYNLDGVDFDYEENQPQDPTRFAEQEKRVGQLIRAFKDQAPDLRASLCTCAGENWQADAKNIFDQTLDANGVSVIDHLYIMSYAGTTQQVESWADDWDAFLEQYKLDPSAVTIGIYQYGGYDYDAVAKYAASKGYSTMIWNYNPTAPSDFAEKIYQDYNQSN